MSSLALNEAEHLSHEGIEAKSIVIDEVLPGSGSSASVADEETLSVKSPDKEINTSDFSRVFDFACDMPWYISIPLVAHSLGFGYQISKDLMDYSCRLPGDSFACEFGFKTLGSIVTSKRGKGGLGYDWNDWRSSVKAYLYRSNFGVYYKDKERVIQEVDAVVSALGKEPKTIIEYYKNRDAFVFNEKNKQINDSERRAELAEKYRSFLIARIEKLNGHVKDLKENQAREISKAQDEARSVVEFYFEDEMRALNNEISNLKELLGAKDEELSGYQKKITEIASDRDSLYEKLEELKSLYDDDQSTKYDLELTISDLESRLKSACDGSFGSDNSEEIDRLKGLIKNKNDRVYRLKGKVSHYKEENKVFKSENKSLAKSLDRKKERNKKICSDLKNSRLKNKKLRNAYRQYYNEVRSMKKQWNVMFVGLCFSFSLIIAGIIFIP